MQLRLAAASLRRHRARTILAVAGVAVSAAMLLDMVMLATGMRESFRSLLEASGMQLRLSPRGTLPFDTDATIGGAAAIMVRLARNPDVRLVAPVLGGQLHVPPTRPGAPAVTAFAIGLDPARQADYVVEGGTSPRRDGEIVANAAFLRATGARLGDTLRAAAGYDPQLRTYQGMRPLVVVASARFIYVDPDEPTAALPLATLQAMGGPERTDRVSLFMVRVRDGADVEAMRRWVEDSVPAVSALSTAEAIRQADERLSYFRQLAFILGAVSLAVGFLLVTTLMTVSVNERVGEIAVLRAIGVSVAHVVQWIVAEGLAISLAGAVLGLGLGLVTGRWLNAILSDFPGLPPGIDFFLFQPSSAFRALGLLVVAGVLAGVYPSWRAARLPVARTLREEAVG